jgi:hypothetical protein
MEQMELELELEAFLDAGDKLLRMLPVDEKHQLLYGNHPKRACTGEINWSFKPELNQKSLNIINRKEKQLEMELNSMPDTYGTPARHFARHMKNTVNIFAPKNFQHWESKECKPETDELEGCTFHPKINKYVPVKSCYEY